MKKSHILGIAVIAIAMAIIISTTGDASSYVSFREARAMALDGDNSKIHVVGSLKKANEEIMGLEESRDKLSFSFLMVDNNGEEQKVFYPEPMPADFTRSEQVVVIGSFKKETFLASKILMKCPSKYKEEKVKV